MLHVSTLERWQVPVVNDYVEGRKVRTGDYRPINLISAIEAQKNVTITLPVVGWDGDLINPSDVSWPVI